MNLLKSLRSSRHNSLEKKESRFASLTSLGELRQPTFGASDYRTLAQLGYEKNVIVHRAVNLIARSMGSVPWCLFQNDERITSHPLLDLLARPNPLQGGNVFIETVTSYLLLSGNAYVEAVSTGSTPSELYTLRPDRLKILPGRHGIPLGYEYSVGTNKKIVPVDERGGASPILHLKFFHPLNDWYGLSPLEAAVRSIHCHNTVANHNLSLLKHGGRPSGALLLKPDGRGLTKEQRQELRTSLQDLHQGTQNAGQIMILEGDFEWKEMGLSPKDMDFSEGKNMSAREIAQIFGVPPMLVGVPGDATFSNYKEARLHLWEDTILPLLDRLINQFNAWLIPQFSTDLRLGYDSDAIPPLAAKREKTWERINQCNFLTLNEKREAVGYPPLPDDIHPNTPSAHTKTKESK